jgi:hypothetical protein
MIIMTAFPSGRLQGMLARLDLGPQR